MPVNLFPLDWSVGGEAYWAVGSHLYVPLPVMSWLTGQHLKGHGFVNAGNLISTGYAHYFS